MNFYHYANEALDYIKSLRKEGNVTQSDIDAANKQARLTDAVGDRLDAIQFYVFPQSKERLSDAGIGMDKPIYQCEVAITNLPVNVVWALKDTRQYLSERANFSKSPDGGLDVETHMNNWSRKNNHSGRGIAALQKAIKKYATNFAGRPDKTAHPVLLVYPYVGYIRVTACTQTTF